MATPFARFVPNPGAPDSASVWRIGSRTCTHVESTSTRPRSVSLTLISVRCDHEEIGRRGAAARAGRVPTTPTGSTPLVLVAMAPGFYASLANADARRLAYWRRIFTWLPQPSMLHQRRLPFLLPS